MQKGLTTGFALLLILILAACNRKPADKKTEDVIPVKVMALQQEAMQPALYMSGVFTTDDETNLSFKNGGIIKRIYVKESDAVKKGQLLAIIDPTEINAMHQQAQLSYTKARRDYERAKKLYEDSVVTLEQMQNAKTALDLAKQQMAGADFNTATTVIRAPQSGYVLHKFANEGQVAGPGMPVLQINGAASGKWILKGGVSDQQWAVISIGDDATVTTDAVPGETFTAKVIKKSEGIDPASGTFIIQLQLADPDRKRIASGLFGKAAITPSHKTNAWVIPYDALLDGDQNSGYVFITNDNKTAKKIQVQIGKIENDRLWISRGLENARNLILSGNAYLTEGSKIKVVR
ncbi:efflux transporter periplasmic adaptor subunit [Niabella ginsenosidivorans]|uniref:Efflux transporter periplasmic adaptor subunit n=1 Tax=Niabella ginsenosidivorans TaxID=1176587 RepID=A0A1A9I371_9BACT|nr:efflux RND transporter periplasmic adaptor subunit [Niabella ginsenosidivorans]ANH81132.1 efflux transporter periplasmic adaptor subunit [Niabella ginsenosidivorans]